MADTTPLPTRRTLTRPALLRSLAIFTGVAILVAGALTWYANTASFATLVRNRLVTTLEKATGGRVELGSFQWRLSHLEFEANNLTIHGLEAPGEMPYAHIDRLFVRAKIISLFRAKIGLNLLEGSNPLFHLIVYPDGSTNQPKPKKTTQHGPITDTLFDLAVDRTEVTHGLLVLNQRAIPFDLSANDLAASVTYDSSRDHYLAKFEAADMTARRAARTPVHSELAIDLDLSRNAVLLKSLRLKTGESLKQGRLLEASGVLENYADPHLRFTLQGSVDVRQIEALTAVLGLEAGIADLQLHGGGSLSAFAMDGEAKVAGAAYRIPDVRVSGVNGSATIHITQDELALTNLKGQLREGGTLNGDFRLTNWLAPTPVAPTRADAAAVVAKKTQNLPAPPVSTAVHGVIHAQVRDVSLRTVLAITAPAAFADLGFETAASGPVSVEWTGTPETLRFAANLALAGGDSSRGVPLSGALDATYYQGRGAVDIRKLTAQTPGSHIEATGSLGVYPLTRGSRVDVDATTDNLGEFDKTLVALGLSIAGSNGTRRGVAAIPVQLHGKAEFHGTVTGSLLQPDVKGHLAATDFDTVFETARSNPPSASLQKVTAAPGEPPSASSLSLPAPSLRTSIHWDSLDTKAEYSPELLAVEKATLRRGTSTVHASGQLRAHQITRHRYDFDDEAAVSADVSVQNEAVADLLTIAGSSAPVTGTLNLEAHVGGTMGNLSGGGHVSVAGGEIYGEAYRSLHSDLKFVGHEVDATNLKFLQNGGQITGGGGYDLRAGTLHFQASGTGFDLAHIKQVQRPNLVTAGQLSFQASGAGSVEAPTIQATLHLADLAINNEFKGSLDAQGHLDHRRLTYDVNSALDAARFQLAGETTLSGDYPTQARLTATQVHIERFLRMFNVQDVSSDSILNLQGRLSGPARLPKQMQGSVDVNKFEISVGGVALKSATDLTAQLKNGVLHLDPLRITGDDTNLQAQGSVALFEAVKALDFHANGAVNLQLAHSFDPDITSSGHMDFAVDATGTVQQPNLVGQVKFTNGAIALGDLPNGLSKIEGTLVFDQDRLTVQQLTAVTGGGRLQLGGSITYQQGLYADLTATGKDIRIRYPQGVSSMTDAKLRLQGTETNLLLSGSVLVTRFSISPNLDLASLKSTASLASPLPDANAPSNHVRLDIHVTSAPELNFQNSFAKLAGDVDLRLRGTVAEPALLGHISVTDGSANFAGTTYQLQRGEIYFSNPIHIDPIIDLDATARVEDYDIDIGLHGTLSKLSLSYRSEPPLPEADVFALLALGRTQEEQQIYSQEQAAAGVNSTADALLGGALNATVSSRVQKLFGVGSVKIDPTFVGNLGNSTARITVQEKVGKSATLTYATNVNSTAQQLIAGQLYITPNISIVAERDESGVFSLLLKIHQRRR